MFQVSSSITYSLIPIAMLTVVTGCGDKKKDAASTTMQPVLASYGTDSMADPSVMSLNSTNTFDDPPTEPFSTDAYVEASAPVTAEPSSGRIHVVKRKDTLYSIARLYYNDGKNWKKIYEANQQRLPDPNRIEVGMKLIIP